MALPIKGFPFITVGCICTLLFSSSVVYGLTSTAPIPMYNTYLIQQAVAQGDGETAEEATQEEEGEAPEQEEEEGETAEETAPEEEKPTPTQPEAKIIIEKAGNLGPQDRGDFDAEVTGNRPSPTSVNLGGDESTRTVTIRPGSYDVHEIGESDGRLTDRDFDVSYSDDCSGTIMPRTTVTCTITNDFTGPE